MSIGVEFVLGTKQTLEWNLNIVYDLKFQTFLSLLPPKYIPFVHLFTSISSPLVWK